MFSPSRVSRVESPQDPAGRFARHGTESWRDGRYPVFCLDSSKDPSPFLHVEPVHDPRQDVGDSYRVCERGFKPQLNLTLASEV